MRTPIRFVVSKASDHRGQKPPYFGWIRPPSATRDAFHPLTLPCEGSQMHAGTATGQSASLAVSRRTV